jgi:uncharacterized protein YkwD
MVSFKSLSVLALAGSALAAPAPNQWFHGKKIVWHTVVKTAYVTVYPGAPQPTPKTSSTSVASVYTPTPEEPKATPSSTTIVVVNKRPSSKRPAYTPPAYTPAPVPSSSSTTEAPAYTPAPTPSSTPSSTKAAEPAPTGYMAVVDEWRARLGLKPLIQDAKLEANALDTGINGNGQMVHKLNPGTYGQVLAPGQEDEFYHCFVGGWLCERPTMPGMDGVCETASKGWYYTSTGHADILTSAQYSKIGCRWVKGIWVCDVA